MTIMLLMALLPVAGLAAAAEPGGSCVACHRNVGEVAYLEHNFEDWRLSVHARAGLSCEACHGGDASKQEKEAAHAGVLSSREPKSAVYFTRIPATCGACHEEEFKAFKRSSHSKELQRSGRGPNCVTCHGSMASFVLRPRELEMICTLCHRRPTQAYATLMALNNAGASLKRLDEALIAGRAKKMDVTRQEQAYREAQGMHRAALRDWHTFSMTKVLERAQEIARRMATAINEIQLKEQQKP